MPPKRMTANPVRPARYRPGKAVAEEHTSSEDEDAGSDPEEEQQEPARQPPPKATSFPSEAQRIASNLKNVDLNARRRQADTQEQARKARERAERAREEQEAGFVTESSGGEETDEEEPGHAQQKQPPRRAPGAPTSSDDEEEGSSDEDDSDSSSDAGPPKLLRPVFIRKDQRKGAAAVTDDIRHEEEEARRQAIATEIVQERLEREAAARAAGKKNWDDDDPAEEDAVDDTDDLDPELERQQWVARELGRLKRARQALEEREAELAEVERRKGLTVEEREAEDREVVERQQEEKKGRGKMAILQKYHHKGAFYQEDAREQGLLDRNLMGATYVDQSSVREALPEYLQIRDETKIGRKGRTRYKDLKSEDTGQWGDFGRGDRRGGAAGRGGGRDAAFVEDERFRPDMPTGPRGGTGANSSAVGEKKRAYDDDRRGDEKRPRYDERGR